MKRIVVPMDFSECAMSALKIAAKISDKIDAVISTYPPEVVHLAAYRLAKEHKIPWIADYRDLWFQEGRLPGDGSHRYSRPWDQY